MLVPSMAPRVDNEYRNAIAEARIELRNLISKEKYRASDVLRLAYASQFSIANFRHANEGISTSTDATTKKTQPANNNPIESIKRNHPKITYPDLYQLAGVVALEKLGGPEIKFVPGREDSTISPDEGCLPDISLKDPSDLRGVFHRVGISNSNLIVALCGGLKLARRAEAEKSGVQAPQTEEKPGVQAPQTEEKPGVQAPRAEEKPGVQGPRTEENLKFDNSYFMELRHKVELSTIDKALRDDEEFRKHVDRYATDEDAFKRDYVVAHKKFSELGLPSFFGFEG